MHVGSGLTQFALAVWIYDQTKQATPFAITVLLGSIPRTFLLPVAGSIADRFNRRIIMIIADVSNALLTLFIFVLLGSSSLQLWHIYLVSAVGSILSAFQEPAYTASISMIVPRKNSAAPNGPQMGQALLLGTDPGHGWCLFSYRSERHYHIDFVTFFFAVGALLFVRIPQPERAPEHRLQHLARYVFRLELSARADGPLRPAAVLCDGELPGSTGLPSCSSRWLSRFTADVLGLIQTVMGVGMLAGSIIMSAWGGAKRRIPAAIGFLVLGVTGFIIAGLQPNPFFIGAGVFVSVCLSLASGNSQVVFQTKVARDLQGRLLRPLCHLPIDHAHCVSHRWPACR